MTESTLIEKMCLTDQGTLARLLAEVAGLDMFKKKKKVIVANTIIISLQDI